MVTVVLNSLKGVLLKPEDRHGVQGHTWGSRRLTSKDGTINITLLEKTCSREWQY